MRFSRAIVILVAVGLASTGCAAAIPAHTVAPKALPSPTTHVASPTPAASATPARPALESLVISPEGLGPLKLGSPASASPLLTFMPQYCQIENDDDGFADEDPAADRWLADYPGDDSFDVEVIDGLVAGISPSNPAMRTAKGIHLGSTAAELHAAYPDLHKGIDGGLSRTEYIESGGRMVSFEILNPNADYEPALSDRVVYIVIRAVTSTPPTTVYATDGGLGSCM